MATPKLTLFPQGTMSKVGGILKGALNYLNPKVSTPTNTPTTSNSMLPNLSGSYNPVSAVSNYVKGTTAPTTTPTNNVITNPPSSLGLKTKSVNDNVKTQTNILASKDQAPASISGYTRKGNDVYDPQGNYVSWDKAVQLGITGQLEKIPQQTNQGSGAISGASVVPPVVTPPVVTPPKEEPLTNEGMLKTLFNREGQMIPAVTTAQDLVTQRQAELNALRGQENQALLYNTQPASGYGRSMEYQQGAGAALQNYYAQQENAKAQELAQAQGQVQSALTGQGQLYSAREAAAGLVKPQLGAYGQTYYEPLKAGQAEQGGDVNSMVDYWAGQIATNKASMNDVPDTISGNVQLKTQLQQAIQQKNPSYNPSTQAAGQSSAADLTTQASTLQSVANGAEQNFNLLYNIASQGGVNDANVPVLNTLKQNLSRGLTSNDAVASFQSIIQTVRSQYAAIIGGGTVTVESLNEAKSLIPDDISLSALKSLGDNIKFDAQNRIAGIQEQIRNLTSGTNGATTNNNQSPTWDNI